MLPKYKTNLDALCRGTPPINIFHYKIRVILAFSVLQLTLISLTFGSYFLNNWCIVCCLLQAICQKCIIKSVFSFTNLKRFFGKTVRKTASILQLAILQQKTQTQLWMFYICMYSAKLALHSGSFPNCKLWKSWILKLNLYHLGFW